MRGVGALALSLCLAACNVPAFSATTVSIALSLSMSRDDRARLDARLSPQTLGLRPGEEVTLQLELWNRERGALALRLVQRVAGPSKEMTVQLPATVTAPRGVTNVPVRVRAQQSIVPGRYVLLIVVYSASGPPDDDDKTEDP